MAKANRTKVSAAVEAALDVTPMKFVAYNGSMKQPKTVIARPASELQNALYIAGFALGNDAGDIEQRSIDLLQRCKSPLDRIVLRHGFVDGFVSAPRVIRKKVVWPTVAQADQRYSALARIYSPDTSRKAKSTKAKRGKGAGRKEKTGAKVTSVSAREGKYELALNTLLAAFKAEQENATGDELALYGEWASIARKALRK